MANQSEHRLQVAVAHMLRIVLDPAQTWWSALDHGAGKMTPASAGLRKARGVKAGLPDFILMARVPTITTSFGHEINVSVMFGIELKAAKGALSPVQKELHWDWQRMGFNVHVARSLEDVQAILDDHGVPMRTRMTFMGGGSNGRAARTTQPRDRGPRRAGRTAGSVSLV